MVIACGPKTLYVFIVCARRWMLRSSCLRVRHVVFWQRLRGRSTTWSVDCVIQLSLIDRPNAATACPSGAVPRQPPQRWPSRRAPGWTSCWIVDCLDRSLASRDEDHPQRRSVSRQRRSIRDGMVGTVRLTGITSSQNAGNTPNQPYMKLACPFVGTASLVN